MLWTIGGVAWHLAAWVLAARHMMCYLQEALSLLTRILLLERCGRIEAAVATDSASGVQLHQLSALSDSARKLLQGAIGHAKQLSTSWGNITEWQLLSTSVSTGFEMLRLGSCFAAQLALHQLPPCCESTSSIRPALGSPNNLQLPFHCFAAGGGLR